MVVAAVLVMTFSGDHSGSNRVTNVILVMVIVMLMVLVMIVMTMMIMLVMLVTSTLVLS